MNFKGISKATWTRIITLFVVLVNQIAISIFNTTLIPFDDEAIYEGVSALLTTVVAIITGYKNNSLSKEAQVADEHLKEMRGDK